MLQRSSSNPLICPEDVVPSRPEFEVIGAFNAGAVIYQDQVLLLLRVAERLVNRRNNRSIACPHLDQDGQITITEIQQDDPQYDTRDPRFVIHRESGQILLTSISHLRLARSHDGVHFTIDTKPWLFPNEYSEAFGVEDARITRIDDTYYINYSAVSGYGIATALVSTMDFMIFKRHGIIFPPANRDVTLLPRKVNGLYGCYHRPMPGDFGGYNIWYATSPDLIHWGNHQLVIESGTNGWAAGRVGGGAPPVETSEGWLSIYHAADQQNRYSLGAFLAAHDQPTRIIKHSTSPILVPETPYEREGFFPNVVFSCGVIVHGDTLRIYYGAADERIALAEVNTASLLADLKPV